MRYAKSQAVMAIALVVAFGVVAASVSATPAIDGVAVTERVWNDAPDSVLTTVSNYPAMVSFQDAELDGDGAGGEWANRHIWRLSDNGGLSSAVFLNGDAFTLSSDVTLSGSASMEGGLNLSPWWSKEVDGVMMIRTSDGEISCWGGRLPFYNFTANHGITYTSGETVRLSMTYRPNGLSAADPADILYQVTQGGTTYSSGWLDFSEGNPGEDPPYGLWGMLNDARVGGWFMPKINTADPNNMGMATFENIAFAVPEPATLALLAIGGVAVLRRRR